MAQSGGTASNVLQRNRTWWVALLYAMLTCLFAYPMPLLATSRLFAIGVDTRLFMWALAWDAHAFVHQPLAIFEANTFYPAYHALAFSENFIGSALFGAPILWLTGNPVLMINLVELASAFLCALGAYVLARRAGLDPAGAVLAGLMFGFMPSRFLRIDQLHLTTIQWVPFGLAFLHSYLDCGRRADLRIFLAFLSLQALTSGHGVVFLVVASVGLVLYRVATGEPVAIARRVRDVGVPGVLILVPVGLLVLVYHAAQIEVPELHRTVDDVGVSTASFFASSAHLQEFVLAHAPKWFTTPEADTELFPGYLPVALAIAALWLAPNGRSDGAPPPANRWWRRGGGVLELATVALCAAGAWLTMSGTTRFMVGGAVLFTARRVWRVWMLAALTAVLRIAIASRAPLDIAARIRRPFEAARRWRRVHRRDIAVFYALLALVAFWLTLRPGIGLWTWVYWMPLLNFLRAPQRFVLLELLALAILGGLGFDRLTARFRPARRAVVAAVVGVLMVGEFAAFPLGTEPYRVDLPAVDRWLDDQPKPFVIAEVPMPRSPSFAVIAERNSLYMLHAMAHWQKTVHGYSGVEPPLSTRLFRQLSHFPEKDDLGTLVDLGVRYIVMHTELYRGNELADVEARLRQCQDWLTLEHAEDGGRVYSIHRPANQHGAAPQPTTSAATVR